jgi:hypothetical protein
MLPWIGLIPLIVVHAVSSLVIIGCDVHSILDDIESVCYIKDCENNPPIATKTLETKWQFLEKLKIFAPVSLLAYFLKISFPEKHTLHKNLIFSSNLVHIIHSGHHKKNNFITVAWQVLTPINSIHGTLKLMSCSSPHLT